MHFLDYLFIFLIIKCLVKGNDVPCSPRAGDLGQGQICVCNSTYCDTIERPTKLTPGFFHLYTTSNSTPGFSHTIGSFANELEINGCCYDVLFSVDNSVQKQEILGFGGAFSDSVGYVIGTLPSEAQDKLIESYFGTSGIEYTLSRIPIGSTDFGVRLYYELDDVPYDVYMKNFTLAYEDYHYKIPYIKRAIQASERGFKAYGCTWDAPQWMKTSYDEPDGGAGYLREKYFQAFSEYHVKFVQEYQKNGVEMWALSGGNEVILGFMVGLNCTQELAHMQRVWLKDHLAPALASANLSHVKFLGMEDMRPYILYWTDRMAIDPEAYKASSGIAVHWYFDFYRSPDIMDVFHQRFPDQLIVYTESSINSMFLTPEERPVELGSWKRAALYMYNIIENLNHWTNGYIDWNLVLDTEGGPTLYEHIDAAIIANNVTGEFYKQPMFYAMGHFSKFIPPGSKIVNTTSQDDGRATNGNQEEVSMGETFRAYRRSKTPKAKRGSSPFSEPPWHGITPPEVVSYVASTNSDGSNTIIILNNKNVTQRVHIEVVGHGTVRLDLEERSLNTLIYWTE